MRRTSLLVGAVFASALSACTTDQQGMPLIFGRTQTVGISVAGTVPDQGAHVTLGFSDRNIAIVPTTSPTGEAIRSTSADGRFTDSLSVLGQFEARGSGRDVEANLGTFFSTGIASRNLAEGFRDEMRGFGTPVEDRMVIPRPAPETPQPPVQPPL